MKLVTTLEWSTILTEHQETTVMIAKAVYVLESAASWITMEMFSNGQPAALKISTKLPTLAWALPKSRPNNG
jgi:hypothetical protein